MDGTLVDTEPYWIDGRARPRRAVRRHLVARAALELVGFDLLDSAPLHPRAHGHRPSPRADRRRAARLRDRPGRARGAVAAGARELLASLREAGVPCALVTMSYARFVKPILGCAARRHVRRGGHRRHRRPRQAAPRAVPRRRPASSTCSPAECLADRGLRHRRHLGRRRRLHGALRTSPRRRAAGPAPRLHRRRWSGSRPARCPAERGRAGCVNRCRIATSSGAGR